MEKNNVSQNVVKESTAFSIFEYLELIAMCACIIMVIFAIGIRVCVVDGDSMNQTLQNGDMLITNEIFYEPSRGDIVVFHLNNEYYNKPLIKRVIATEGEWIDIKRSGNGLIVKIYEADDTDFSDPLVYKDEHAYYSILNTGWAGLYDYPVQVPEGCVFVMGDNRWNSSDSRSDKVGFVDKRTIFGHAIVRVSPLNKITVFVD
jgi:signal peptidase I